MILKHAYSHVNALSSAMQAYLVLGDEQYLRAAENGLRFVTEQSHATGVGDRTRPSSNLAKDC